MLQFVKGSAIRTDSCECSIFEVEVHCSCRPDAHVYDGLGDVISLATSLGNSGVLGAGRVLASLPSLHMQAF